MKLEITPEERDHLVHLVSRAMSDIRVEVRRTDTDDFRSQLHREEDLLRSLLEKLQAEPVRTT